MDASGQFSQFCQRQAELPSCLIKHLLKRDVSCGRSLISSQPEHPLRSVTSRCCAVVEVALDATALRVSGGDDASP